MGRTTLRVTQLFSPLESVYERHNTIPAREALVVQDDYAKAVFFLVGGLELELPDGTRRLVREGDCYFGVESGALVYRSANPQWDGLMHSLIMRFRRTDLAVSKRTGTRPEQKFVRALKKRLEVFRYFPREEWGNHSLLVGDVLREMEREGEDAAWKISGICFSILADYLGEPRYAPPGLHREAVRTGSDAVEHVRQYMLEHLREPLTLSQLAWQVRLSPEHLARLFRKNTGETVFACLDRIRLEEAKRLLFVADWPLRDVAERCGYSSANLFCRHFKRGTGETPVGYRIRIRQGEEFSPGRFTAR